MNSLKLPDRYDRNFNSLSREEQEMISQSVVAVIGLGGLGGCVCELLARTGAGHIIGVDGDVFEPSNLNRQLLSQEHLLGVAKAKAAEERIKAINSDIVIECHTQYLDAGSMETRIQDAALVVDCLDSIDDRFVLQDAAQKLRIPLVSGAIAGMTGQVTTVFPDDQGFNLIYGERGKHPSMGIESFTGNLGCCAFFIASFQVSEVIKILTGRENILRNKLFIADLWHHSFDVVDLI